jgi:Ca-activated chloride channel family protein
MNRRPIPALRLALGLDRALAWHRGGSVRYAVADLRAEGRSAVPEGPALNLALAIDVSGSMAGEKIEAARATARQVVAALTARDRLTLVTFDHEATALVDARHMDADGRHAALAAIDQLRERGQTNLWAGWLQAAERIALAMDANARASHRVLLLSDGHANAGVTDAAELARQAQGLAARGIVTSAVGIGDGYDELLLGGMAEQGGGRLHDAERAPEIAEVVLGELFEGRHALLERTILRLVIPASLRAEVVGGWAHRVLPGAIEVRIGMMLPDSPKFVAFRLHCPAAEAGTDLLIGASAVGVSPDGETEVVSPIMEAAIRFARGAENNAHPRDPARSRIVAEAWQAQVLRQAMALNRRGDHRGAEHFLDRELRWFERFARGLGGAEALLAELVLLRRRIAEELSPRLRKEIYAASSNRAFYQKDHRSAPRPDLSERLRRDPEPR